MHLNLYLSRAGIASRRKSVDLIKQGFVTINNLLEKNPAYKVQSGDIVRFAGSLVKQPQKCIYILLNKPKGYVSTTADEKGRKTVLELVPQARKVRLYPIGRLDKDTSGALLLTNDGQLTQRLVHPRYQVAKTYEVSLDKEMSEVDIATLKKGIYLSDGFIKPDFIGYIGKSKRRLKIVLHSGANRIVRRMLEHFDYKVKDLMRTKFDSMTTKNLKPGMWRVLSKKEVEMLKEGKFAST